MEQNGNLYRGYSDSSGHATAKDKSGTSCAPKLSSDQQAVLANSDLTWKAPADVTERMPFELSTEMRPIVDHIIAFFGEKCLAI
jgi:hypothetical protein